jgi:hypothetical protein
MLGLPIGCMRFLFPKLLITSASIYSNDDLWFFLNLNRVFLPWANLQPRLYHGKKILNFISITYKYYKHPML